MANELNNGTALPEAYPAPTAAQVAEAQRAVDAIIDNDKQAIKNLMVSAWMVADLEQRGVDMTDYKAQIRTLYEDIEDRQQLLMEGCDNERQNLYGGVMDKYLAAIVNGKPMPKVGELVTILCIVAAIAVTALVTYLIKDFLDAKTDSHFTLQETETVKQGLQAIEDQYGDDFKDRFVKDIEDQADKHTAEEIWKENFGSALKKIGKWLLYGGIALGALWLWANYGGNFKKKW